MTLKERTRWVINWVCKKHRASNAIIADELGFGESTINNYRQMSSNPNVTFIQKFCEKYGVDVTWLLYGYGEPFPGAREQFPEVCGPSAPPRPGSIEVGVTRQRDLPGFGRMEYQEEDKIFSATIGPEETANIGDRFGRAAAALRDIFDSRDRGIIVALEANIAIFSRTVRADRQLCHITRQNEDITRQNEELRREIDRLKRRMEALEATCSASVSEAAGK